MSNFIFPYISIFYFIIFLSSILLYFYHLFCYISILSYYISIFYFSIFLYTILLYFYFIFYFILKFKLHLHFFIFLSKNLLELFAQQDSSDSSIKFSLIKQKKKNFRLKQIQLINSNFLPPSVCCAFPLSTMHLFTMTQHTHGRYNKPEQL